MKDEDYFLKKPLDELEGNFAIENDSAGFACAISKGGFHVLHLNAGTMRNEEYLRPIIDMLNTHTPRQNEIKAEADLAIRHLIASSGFMSDCCGSAIGKNKSGDDICLDCLEACSKVEVKR